jgi:hypothetical protein
MIPVVLGPDQRYYVVDHHHLARSLHEEGVKDILVSIIADLTMVDPDAFWGVLDNHRWVYPYDAKGERRHFRDIPKTVADLKDDPFRSLAGELRRVGGFAKDTTPFSEFLWADFLRRRISRPRACFSGSCSSLAAYPPAQSRRGILGPDRPCRRARDGASARDGGRRSEART